jgi:peptidoglycan/LPS O-acetylase OafA/YrhL
MKNHKVYFPNLNSLRAIAALIVVISHVESIKGEFMLQINNKIVEWGSIAVTLFFVLSGYLITYLILKEKTTFKKINIKQFYLRRALRIWPLFYLILFFVYFLIPSILPEYYSSNLDKFTNNSIALNIFFLTNVTAVLNLTPQIMGTIWSIGIEEQFYIFWPWLIKLKKKKAVRAILVIIILLPILKVFFLILSNITDCQFLKQLYYLINYSRFDCMALGGLFGFIGYYKKITLFGFQLKYNYFISKKVQIINYIILLLIFFFSTKIIVIDNFLYLHILPFIFAITILNLSTNANTILKIENKVLNYFGKISYSIYLNHLVVIFLIKPFLIKYIYNFTPFIKNIFLFSIIIFFVLICSILSFELYEVKFIKIKNKFSKIKT